MKKLLLLFVIFISANLFGQNITNTLGTGGNLYVKDASTTFLTLQQSNGYLGLGTSPNQQLEITGSFRLPVTTNSTTGVIYKGTNHFIHDYKPPSNIGYNTFVGIDAGNFTMGGGTSSDGSYNTAIGRRSLYSNTTGNSNIAIGYASLSSNTTGYYNTSIGTISLAINTTGIDNTAIGYGSLFSNTTANKNTAVGFYSLYTNNTGYENTAIGFRSLTSNTTGYYNTAVGSNSLSSNTTGWMNTAIGDSSLYSNTTGGYQNTAIGFASLSSNTDGKRNTAIGNESLYSNTDGLWNTAIGFQSLFLQTGGNSNTATGYASLYSNITGNNNTANGRWSLYSTTGGNNTALGYNAGYNLTTGGNCTIIGYDAQPSSPTVSNEIILGNSSIGALRCNVQTITSLSDKRDKTNINDLSFGLDFICKLKPREFNWDRREWYEEKIWNEDNTAYEIVKLPKDGSKMEDKLTAGFIAQELDEAQNNESAEWLELVYHSNPERLEATPGNLLPVMVKAIQELKEKNDVLVAENMELKTEMASLLEIKDELTELKELKAELSEQLELLKADNNSGNTKVSFKEN